MNKINNILIRLEDAIQVPHAVVALDRETGVL